MDNFQKFLTLKDPNFCLPILDSSFIFLNDSFIHKREIAMPSETSNISTHTYPECPTQTMNKQSCDEFTLWFIRNRKNWD